MERLRLAFRLAVAAAWFAAPPALAHAYMDRTPEAGPDPGWTAMPELLGQSVLLNKEKSRAAASRRHAS